MSGIGAERARLQLRNDNKGWKKWGPYLTERQWGTVREDYSAHGNAWGTITHDMARSKAYRWGEEGIGGGQTPSKSQFASQPLFAPGVPVTPIVFWLPAS